MDGADVLVENFRPGTLERWDLAPETLMEENPGLVIARVSGFGQFGPYARRPGFGTLAESMSGFASLTGQPDAPPTLPPFGLADGITGLTVANAVLMALWHRDRTDRGRGQVIDCAIIEPIMGMLGPHALVYDQLGIIQPRTGNRSASNAPRNTYRTRDDRWVAISTSAQSIADRVITLVGHPELVDEPWFSSGQERASAGRPAGQVRGRLDSRAGPRRGGGGVHRGPGGRGAHLRHLPDHGGSPVPGARLHHRGGRSGVGEDQDAERAVPHVRHAGTGPLERARQGRRQPAGLLRGAGPQRGRTRRAGPGTGVV